MTAPYDPEAPLYADVEIFPRWLPGGALPGDVNGDGCVSISDVSTLLNMLRS